MCDQQQMFRNDGSYDFKKREDWDYKHGYKFMSGWLGTEEVEKEKKRKKKLGTTDLPAPPLPKDLELVGTIEKTAKHVHKSTDPTVLEHMLQQKKKGEAGWGFLSDGGEANDYYVFCRHCCEREVDPRPLAEQARRVLEDREIKQANAKANAFAAGSGADVAPREAKFKEDELMEVIGIKNKPDYNGNIVKILKFHPDVDRYEVKFTGGRYDTVIVKLREENLMYSAVTEHEAKVEMLEGEIPNGVRVEIRGLQSEAARWLNGQKGVIIQWLKDTERYEVRLEYNNDVKKVKPGNVRAELPPDWEEHYDEHLGRNYYLNNKLQKVTWKHPVVTNFRAKFNKIKENNAEELDEVEIDHEHTHYEVDDEEELEGNFSLMELVAKIEEKEEKLALAEARGEDPVDSDDGMHEVSKKRKKKKKQPAKIDTEALLVRIAELVEHTMVGRVSLKKDYTMLEGHFIAVKELDPVAERLQNEIYVRYPRDEMLKEAFEVALSGLDKAIKLGNQLRRSKLTLRELAKLVDRLTTLTTPDELLKELKWVSTFLKTM